MVAIVNGDLLKSRAQYICHQVNCQGVMRSGVAKQIREEWPKVFERYKEVCDEYDSRREQLLGQIQGVRVNEQTAVINIFGQYNYGYDRKKYTDMDALRRGCMEIAGGVKPGSTIAMPYRIGCYRGGGDWGEVMDMLADVFRDHKLILYRL